MLCEGCAELKDLLAQKANRIQDLEVLAEKLLYLLGKAVDPKTSPGQWIMIVTDYLAITGIPEVKEIMKKGPATLRGIL